MGQGNSTLQVHVQLEQQNAYTGDVVRGSVYVVAQEPIQVNGLHVKVVGTETCSWTEQHGEHQTHYSNKHHVMMVKVILLDKCLLAPGSYQYPISFQLPPGLPGSFAYSGCSSRAAIAYKVKAHLDREGAFTKDAKHACPFNVMERSKSVPRPVAISKEEVVSYYCCFNKGMILLEASMPTDTLTPGDNNPVPISVKVTNNSSVLVKSVQAEVVQQVVLKSSRGKVHSTNSVVSSLSQRLPINGTGCVASRSAGNHQTSISVPNTVEATVNGQVLSSNYVLRVRANTGCCLTSPMISVPLTLNDPQPVIIAQPVPTLPDGWDPVVAPTYNISMYPLQGYVAGKPEVDGMPTAYGSYSQATGQATGTPVQYGSSYMPSQEVPGQVPGHMSHWQQPLQQHGMS